jgi:hypothetical protein
MANASAAVTTVKNLPKGFDSVGIKSAASAIKSMISALKGMSEIKSNSSTGFIATLNNLSEVSIDTLKSAFDVSKYDVKDIGVALTKTLKTGIDETIDELRTSGETAVKTFVDGMSTASAGAKTVCLTMIADCVTALSGATTSFEDAGKNLVKGFANGISANTYMARAKAAAMAAEAAKAAKRELDEHSPSKVGYEIGDFFGVAFVNALGDYAEKAYAAGSGIAKSAKTGLRDAVAGIAAIINSDVDTQPTIRPVFDLSEVKSGANAINGMLTRSRTLSVNTQTVGALSASMAKLQNGNNSHELLSAIKGLRKDMVDNPRNSYSIGGITVQEGSDVAEAIEVLARAIKVEGRT